MQCSLRAGAKLKVAAGRPQRFAMKIHAVRPDVPLPQADTVAEKANSFARVAATGALSAVVAASALLSASVAHAGADLALGKQVFDGNCAACHAGGNNTVIPDHTLRKAAMEQFLQGGFNLESIVYQVENGKGAMPAWEGTLDDDEIQAVAAYVYDQAAGDKW
eukprot:GHUV01000235.1.p1 GENE.GHUV01000235.1~~GHUV01000235.1.p1  ORF type:complete len:163 (+),score=50.59 GHUV01000235.1:158-646(+)